MKNILFIGLTDYDLSRDDPSLQAKFAGLGRFARLVVMARGRGWKLTKYGVNFYLTPKYYPSPIWLLIVFCRSLVAIRKEKIDLIIAQSPTLDGVMAGVLKLLTGKKLIVEVHGDWIESPFLYHRLPAQSVLKQFFITCGRISLRLADKVRVISDFTANLVTKYRGAKADFQFPTFTDIDKFLLVNDIIWEPIVLYVGALYRLKGVQFLISAMAQNQLKYPQVKLVIVGSGPFRQALEDLAKSSAFKNIQFVGQLPANQVRVWMKRCSVLVLPSLSEGLGRVLIEAAALGKPLIGSQTGGITEVIIDEQNGYLVPPGDVMALADRLERILSDQRLAQKLGQRGRAMVSSRFSTESYFSHFQAMINFSL